MSINAHPPPSLHRALKASVHDSMSHFRRLLAWDEDSAPGSFESDNSELRARLEALLDEGADIEELDSHGATPLAVAAFHGLWKCVDLLIDRGANIHVQPKEKMSIVCQSILSSREDILEKLLSQGAQSSAVEPPWDHPLIAAAQLGHADCVDVLLNHGFEIDQANGRGATALIEAAANDRRDCVRLLIERGANIDLPDQENRAPLIHASMFDHPDCLAELAQRGARLDAVDREGKSAADHAAATGRLKCLMTLAEHGADLSKQALLATHPKCAAFIASWACREEMEKDAAPSPAGQTDQSPTRL